MVFVWFVKRDIYFRLANVFWTNLLKNNPKYLPDKFHLHSILLRIKLILISTALLSQIHSNVSNVLTDFTLMLRQKNVFLWIYYAKQIMNMVIVHLVTLAILWVPTNVLSLQLPTKIKILNAKSKIQLSLQSVYNALLVFIFPHKYLSVSRSTRFVQLQTLKLGNA